jgi:hypothetical protein
VNSDPSLFWCPRHAPPDGPLSPDLEQKKFICYWDKGHPGVRAVLKQPVSVEEDAHGQGSLTDWIEANFGLHLIQWIWVNGKILLPSPKDFDISDKILEVIHGINAFEVIECFGAIGELSVHRLTALQRAHLRWAFLIERHIRFNDRTLQVPAISPAVWRTAVESFADMRPNPDLPDRLRTTPEEWLAVRNAHATDYTDGSEDLWFYRKPDAAMVDGETLHYQLQTPETGWVTGFFWNNGTIWVERPDGFAVDRATTLAEAMAASLLSLNYGESTPKTLFNGNMSSDLQDMVSRALQLESPDPEDRSETHRVWQQIRDIERAEEQKEENRRNSIKIRKFKIWAWNLYRVIAILIIVFLVWRHLL